MFSFENIFLIARREYLERVRAKSFVIMTILIPVLIGGIMGGSILANRHLGAVTRIAVVTSDKAFAEDLRSELSDKDAGKAPAIDVHAPSEPNVRDNLNAELKAKNSTLDGYLVVTPAATPGARPTFQWTPRTKSDIITRSRVASAIRGVLTREQLLHSGMEAVAVNSLLEPVDLTAADGGKDSSGASFASVYAVFFLMYFIILFYGMNVARSIIEEKTSRVFEVMLATTKPVEMLAGKVIGVGSVGLTQVAIWLAVALGALKFGLIATDVNVLPTLPQTALFIVLFVMGYTLYSSIAAALGAMVNSEQELQQLQMLMMLPLMVCSVLVFSVVTSPDSPIAKVFSFIPFCTPLIMYVRFVVGKPGALGVGISIVELALTIAFVLWVAARIYRVGILMYGKKPNLPEIMRWLKYS